MFDAKPFCLLGDGARFWENLIDDNELSDTKVVLKNKEGHILWEFGVHSLVLRRRSEVFKKLITKLDETIIFDGTDLFILKRFFKYLYEGEIYVETWEEILQLLELSVHYEMVNLTFALEISLIQSINLRNVCQFLGIAQRFGLKKMEQHCLDMIVRGAVIVFGSSGYQKLSREQLALVLSDSRLNVSNEFEVVKALVCWAKARTFMENVKANDDEIYQRIKPLLNCVRLLQVTPEQKALLPKGINDLVFPDTLKDDKDQKSLNPRVPLKSVCILSEFAELILKNQNSTIVMSNSNYREVLALRFSVNMPIFLGGFMMNYQGSENGKARIIVRPSNSKIAGEPNKDVGYSLNIKITCHHVLTNEPTTENLLKGHCFELDYPIQMFSGDECSVYFAIPGNPIYKHTAITPSIDFQSLQFKTVQGPTFKLLQEKVIAVRKIHYLSACGRCSV